MHPLPCGLHLAHEESGHLARSSGVGRVLRQFVWLCVAAVFIAADWLVTVREKSRRRATRARNRG